MGRLSSKVSFSVSWPARWAGRLRALAGGESNLPYLVALDRGGCGELGARVRRLLEPRLRVRARRPVRRGGYGLGGALQHHVPHRRVDVLIRRILLFSVG